MKVLISRRLNASLRRLDNGVEYNVENTTFEGVHTPITGMYIHVSERGPSQLYFHLVSKVYADWLSNFT